MGLCEYLNYCCCNLKQPQTRADFKRGGYRKGVFYLNYETHPVSTNHNESIKKKNMVLAMAYVPSQEWKDVYVVDYAFERGTIFAELDKPWFGGDCHEQTPV